MKFSTDVLWNNIKRVPRICSDFIFTGTGIVIPIIALFVVTVLILKKRFAVLTMVVADFVLVLLFLSVTKTADYAENSVLFSQSRMLLFATYSLLPIMAFTALSCKADDRTLRNHSRRIAFCIFSLAVISVVYKIYIVERQLRMADGDLYNPYGCNLYRTSDICSAADRVAEYAKKYGSDVIVIRSDCRALAYALDALYYGNFTVYNIIYDRRTWNYHCLLHRKPHICAFVDYSPGKVHIDVVNINNQSIVEYIAENYGIYRNPYLRQ